VSQTERGECASKEESYDNSVWERAGAQAAGRCSNSSALEARVENWGAYNIEPEADRLSPCHLGGKWRGNAISGPRPVLFADVGEGTGGGLTPEEMRQVQGGYY